jgi:hypothetical protein
MLVIRTDLGTILIIFKVGNFEENEIDHHMAIIVNDDWNITEWMIRFWYTFQIFLFFGLA